MEPSAQVPNVANTEGGTAPGAEARIAELTAAREEANRKLQEREAQFAELQLRYEKTANVVAATLGVGGQNQAPTIDAARKAELDGYLGPIMQRFERMLGGMQFNNAQRELQESFEKNYVPESARKRALEIQNQFAQKGTLLNPEVALTQALGMEYREKLAAEAKANAGRQNFNGGYSNLGNGAHMNLGGPLPTSPEKPANFNDWTAGQQAAWYQKNLGDVGF